MMKKTLARYLGLISLKRKRNLVEQSLIAVYYVYRKMKDALAKSDSRTIAKFYLEARNLRRSIKESKYTFVTVDELVMWTTEWIKSIPNNFDAVVGIPRSGLLVANLIAIRLGKPLTTPDIFSQNHCWVSKAINKKGEYKNVLLVDDVIGSGKSFEESLQLLRSGNGHINVTKAALIAYQNSKDLVDLYYKIIPKPSLFEWNLMHALKRGKLASDLDGVICEDCPPGIDQDEELYTNWIRTANPHLVPTFEIDAIVSCRLERYRSDTEAWLKNHGVRYKELILWNIPSKAERNGKNAQHKIDIFLIMKPDIIWESSLKEAKQIWQATRITTLCIDEMILFS